MEEASIRSRLASRTYGNTIQKRTATRFPRTNKISQSEISDGGIDFEAMRWSNRKRSGTESTQTRYKAYCLFFQLMDWSVGSAREQQYYRPSTVMTTNRRYMCRSNYTYCNLVPREGFVYYNEAEPRETVFFFCRMPFHHDGNSIGSGRCPFFFGRRFWSDFITTVVVITFGSFI